MAQSDITRYLDSIPCAFVEISELVQWYKSIGGSEENLLKQLSQLVEEGHLGTKSASGVSIYWLKDNQSTSLPIHIGTPPSTKRPIVTNSTTPVVKKQRLDTGRTPAGEGKRLLQDELKDKQEKLRKLKMVQLYNSKNNLEKLESLIRKWRSVSQEVADYLLQKTVAVPRPSLGQLLQFLQVDYDLIHYSPDDESFY